MPSSLSMRRFTDSFASIALTVKCLPTSRMKSIALNAVSHSALLSSRAGLGARVEIEKARKLRADALDVRLHLLRRQELTLDRLAAGIADEPGAAADEGDRRVAVALHVRERHHDEQRPDVQARRRGIEPDVAGDPLARQDVANTFGGVVDKAAPLQLAIQVHQSLL